LDREKGCEDKTVGNLCHWVSHRFYVFDFFCRKWWLCQSDCSQCEAFNIVFHGCCHETSRYHSTATSMLQLLVHFMLSLLFLSVSCTGH